MADRWKARACSAGTACAAVGAAFLGRYLGRLQPRYLKKLVGAGRFELPTPCSRSNRVCGVSAILRGF